MAQRRRLVRALAWIVGAWIVATVATVFALRWVNPPTTAFMMNARIDAVKKGDDSYRRRFEWVDYEHISPYAALAVIAAEDQRFPQHSGFDLKSIGDSIEKHRDGKGLRGASTISQQVAKNLFLWQGQNFVRKGLEAYFTVLIETLWPKQRILEMYLNIAEFGRGVYGVGAASRNYFGQSAGRLTPSESALLAAVLPSPRRFSVRSPSRYVQQRQNWILWQMQALGGRSYLFALESSEHKRR